MALQIRHQGAGMRKACAPPGALTSIQLSNQKVASHGQTPEKPRALRPSAPRRRQNKDCSIFFKAPRWSLVFSRLPQNPFPGGSYQTSQNQCAHHLIRVPSSWDLTGAEDKARILRDLISHPKPWQESDHRGTQICSQENSGGPGESRHRHSGLF